jgi:hypothetical protein
VIVLKREHAHDVGLGQDPLGERVFPRRQLSPQRRHSWADSRPLATAE